MRLRLFRVFLVPVLLGSLFATGLTLTADVGSAAAVSCGSATEKVRWEFWSQSSETMGPSYWADYNLIVRNACWTSSTTYCGTVSIARVTGNAAFDSATWGCVKNSNGSTRHWMSGRVRTLCSVPPWSTLYGYVQFSITLWPGGGYTIANATAQGNSCYWAYADEYRR